MITYTRIANCAKCRQSTGVEVTVPYAKLIWCEDCQEPETLDKLPASRSEVGALSNEGLATLQKSLTSHLHTSQEGQAREVNHWILDERGRRDGYGL